MNSEMSAKCTKWCCRILALLVIVMIFAFPTVLGWFRILRQLTDTACTVVMAGFYLCVPLVLYALWSMDEKTKSFYNNDYLIFTVPIVLLITMKYSLDIEGESDGDPVEVLLHDKVLVALCVLYLAVMFMILYL